MIVKFEFILLLKKRTFSASELFFMQADASKDYSQTSLKAIRNFQKLVNVAKSIDKTFNKQVL